MKNNAILYGTGLCLYTINNTALSLSFNGKVILWLPWIGIILMLLAISRAIGTFSIKDLLAGGRRDHWYIIPCLILMLCLVISVRGTDLDSWGMRLYLLAILGGGWVMGRVYGMAVFVPLIVFSCAASLSVIGYTIATLDDNGGIISGTNYDLAVATLSMGAISAIYASDYWPQYQKLLTIALGIILLGLIATLAAEALVALAALFVIALMKRREDVASLTLCATVACWTVGTALSERFHEVQQSIQAWGDGRAPAFKQALTHINAWGQGFSINDYQLATGTIAHSQLLAVLQQAGPLAAGAWMTTIWAGLRHKYWAPLIIVIVALGLFDHMIWTALAPIWWTSIGMASNYNREGTYDIPKRTLEMDYSPA